MKKILMGFCALSIALAVTSCKDEDRLPAPDAESFPLILPQVTSDTAKNYFDYQRARASNNQLSSYPATRGNTRPVFEFTINPTGPSDVELEAVEVYKSYRRVGILGPRVKLGDYSSFPATISLTYPEAIAGLRRSNGMDLLAVAPAAYPNSLNNLVQINDEIVFTFEYRLTDGRKIILTPLNSIGAPTGTFINSAYTAVAVIRRPR